MLKKFPVLKLASGTAIILSVLATKTCFAQHSTQTGSKSAYSNASLGPSAQDSTFEQLRKSALANDRYTSEALAGQLQGYSMPIYVDYYRIRPKLFNTDGSPDTNAPDQEVIQFIQKYKGEALADRMINDYLLVLGERQDWNTFNKYYPTFELKDDEQVSCYGQLGLLSKRQSDMNFMRAILTDSKVANKRACARLLSQAASQGALSEEYLNYFAALAAYNSSSNGQTLAQYSSNQSGASQMVSLINSANNDTSNSLGYSILSAARSMSPQQGALALAYYGYSASRRAAADAATYFQEAYKLQPNLKLPDDILSWQARAGMRSGNWSLVANAVDNMTKEERESAIWAYWRGKAAQSLGDRTLASQWFNVSAQSPKIDFYQILAKEELGQTPSAPGSSAPTEAEVEAASRIPGFARSRKFFDMGMIFEANREWNYPLRKLDDRQLLAAAEYARRVGLLDRMINTSDRTKTAFNLEQRYPTPYLDVMSQQAPAHDISPAWAYGIIRQESRFVTAAQSSANAHGLMQIIPATAKSMAKREGLTGFTTDQLRDVNTNVQLGTAYLQYTRDGMGGSLPLASAAYNAGPGRPVQWRKTLTGTVDGAVFAETIPFTETRGYVKNVMANTYYYYLALNKRPPSLKSMMGTVSPL